MAAPDGEFDRHTSVFVFLGKGRRTRPQLASFCRFHDAEKPVHPHRIQKNQPNEQKKNAKKNKRGSHVSILSKNRKKNSKKEFFFCRKKRRPEGRLTMLINRGGLLYPRQIKHLAVRLFVEHVHLTRSVEFAHDNRPVAHPHRIDR